MRKFIFTMMLLACTKQALTQTRLENKLKEVKALVTNRNRSITMSILDSVLIDRMYAIGGTNLKEGKAFGTSAVIDDKSATVNLSLKPGKKMFFILPTIAASSSNGFADVFSGGQYNKVFSGGINFQRFLYSSLTIEGKNWQKTTAQLHNMLRAEIVRYQNSVDTLVNTWAEDLKKIREIYRQHEALFMKIDKDEQLSTWDLRFGAAEDIKTFYKTVNKLVKDGVFEAGILQKATKKIYDQVAAFGENQVKEILLKKTVAKLDSLQYHFPSNHHIRWIGGGIIYNNEPQPILDPLKPGTANTFYNEYISLKLNISYLTLRHSGSSFLFSPNMTVSDARNFKDTDKKTVNFLTPVTIGTVTGQLVDSTNTYFDKIAGRKWIWSVELPFLFYNSKTNLGLDLAFHFGINDLRNDNIGVRLGLYVPVSSSGDKVVSIEPLIKLQKLFANGSYNFFKDNFVFGFNVSVSLPAFISGK